MKWENLKNEIITSNKDFFDVVEMVWIENFYLILNNSYEKNGNLYIPMVMEINKKEVIIYVVESCIGGEITGHWEIAKAWEGLENEEEFDYDYWKNHWIKEISHDLICSDEYFEGKALKKIITDVKHIYATSNKQNAFYMAKNYLVEAFMFDKGIWKYASLSESNRLRCNVTRKYEVIESFGKDDIHSSAFMMLKNENAVKLEFKSNNYRISIKNPEYDSENGLEIDD